MISLFLFSLAALALPVTVTYIVDKRVRALGWAWVPPGLLFSFGSLATAAAMLHGHLPFGELKLFFAEALATLVVWGVLRQVKDPEPRKGFQIILLASILLLLDAAVISLRQGWHFEGFFLGDGPGYFRMPFHEDMMRNVSLVTALLRGGDSPFLAGAPLVYQSFWFHFAALCASFFRPVSYYPLVLGVSLATQWLFLVVLLWVGLRRRPDIFLRPRYALPLLAIWLFHADIANILVSLLRTGQIGMEADWSMTHVSPFRYLSPKFLTLVGPQHGLFLTFFLAALVFRAGAPRFIVGEAVALTFAFFTAPILYLIGIPGLWWYTRSVPVKSLLVTTLAALSGFHYVLGFPPWWLAMRPGSTRFEWLPSLGWQWLTLPILPAICLGFVGVAFLFLAVRRGRSSWREVLPVFFLLVFFNFFVVSPEIRRHCTMVTLILAGWVILHWIRVEDKTERGVLSALASLAIVGHVYFLYSYTLKPNILRTDIPWRDYFSMNSILRERFPGVPALSAIGSAVGIAKPVTAEATSSFALAVDAVTHSRVTGDRLRVLKLEDREKQILPYAKELGYRLVVWGPVEKEIWGERAEKRFISPENRKARAGEVSLYEWKDQVLEKHLTRKFKNYSDSACALAESLAELGWHTDAIELFVDVLKQDAKSVRAHWGLGRSLQAEGMDRSARLHFDQAKSLRH